MENAWTSRLQIARRMQRIALAVSPATFTTGARATCLPTPSAPPAAALAGPLSASPATAASGAAVRYVVHPLNV